LRDENTEQKLVIDESQINNYLKDAWKEVENLGSKVQNFKTNLFNEPLKEETTTNVLNKIKDKDLEFKDHSKVMGFGTNRIVSNKLNKTNLSASQAKGMSLLSSICDVKKKPPEEKKENLNVNQIEEKKEERKPSRMKNLMTLDTNDMKNEVQVAASDANE